MPELHNTRVVCALVFFDSTISSNEPKGYRAKRRMIQSVWLAGIRSHRVERMSIEYVNREVPRQTDVSWRLGNR